MQVLSLMAAVFGDGSASVSGGGGAIAAPPRCPHGFAMLEISIPHSLGLVDAVAVLFSLVPWLGCFALFAVCVHKGDYALRVCSLMLLTMIAVNEFVFKTLVSQARPVGSCLQSLGMPSSHALLSAGFLAYVVFEELLGDVELNGFRLRSQREKWWLLIGLAVLLAPVPASRVYLNDHSTLQVTVGASAGIAMAFAFFLGHKMVALTHKKRRRHRNRKKHKLCKEEEVAGVGGVRERNENVLP